jgi:hypothetical protein
MRLKHNAEEAEEVRREGRAAARSGCSEHDNPYHRLTTAYRHWRMGFGVASSPIIGETIMKHTPGPWHRNIKPTSKFPIVFAGRNTHVAQVLTRGLSDEESEANCDLIAGAPALLEAAEALLNGGVFEVANILNLRRAVAAAKGERD